MLPQGYSEEPALHPLGQSWNSSLLGSLEEEESRSLETFCEPASHAKGREARQIQGVVGVLRSPRWRPSLPRASVPSVVGEGAAGPPTTSLKSFHIYFFILICICLFSVCVYTSLCHDPRVEAREQLTGHGFLLPSCVSVRLGHECLDLLRYRNGSCHFFGFLR